MEATCSASGCSNAGTLKCAACGISKYCSRECQRTHWKADHKQNCTATSKANCFIIRAPTSSEPQGKVEPFNLDDYGVEFKERQALKAKLGWKSAMEAAKFYDHTGSDKWYYYVYGADPQDETAGAMNTMAGAACAGFRCVYGDLAVVRSGPVGSKYPTSFAQRELEKTLEYYKTADANEVFTAREQSRAFGKL